MKIQNAFTLGLVATLGVGVGLLILGAVASLATILTYIGVAIFVALGLDPIISWLERKHWPRWLAILTVLVAVLGVFTGLVFAVVPIIVEQTSQLIDLVPTLVNQLLDRQWRTNLTEQLGGFIDVEEVYNAILTYFQDASNVTALAGGALQVGIGIASGLFGVIIVLILTLYFTASLNGMKRAVYRLVPASKRERFADLSEQVTGAVGRYVVGQISLALCNGVLSFIFLSIIQAPFPAVLAFLAGMLSLIPLVGTISGSTIIVLVCLIPGLGSPLTALVAAIYYIVYMQVEAYLLSPKIMNRAVSVPGSIVVIAALAGGTLLGVLGALIAIPIAASFLLIIKQVVIPIQNER
ncbi:AI-2E family transporter [Herbiconiux sp. CPCC 203407]|uniref:AI-2E family transporter n=1 Tax=Herbiconiux oxytropis TaxID=2970915 RepID=A0AA41XEW0_9MICO|nr:AI-2E family transporter [Herbiconiux oxytropis]MCS5720936.1 AI-2E family transporter [Herbiconiux oxytropis]MCS5724413.1 AI-2E family transporter [Herbiconiux oxytropis]